MAEGESPTGTGKPEAGGPFWTTLMGIVIGALLAGGAQVLVEWQKNQYDQERLRDARAEEIVTLATEAPALYTQLFTSLQEAPTKLQKEPIEPERVRALVDLYFPNIHKAGENFEAACLNHYRALQEIVMRRLNVPVPDPADESATFNALYSARAALVEAVRREVNSSRKPLPTSHRLELYSLLSSIAGTLLLIFFPAAAPLWTETGALAINFVGNPSAHGWRMYRLRWLCTRAGFVLLLLGFAIQLVALQISGG